MEQDVKVSNKEDGHRKVIKEIGQGFRKKWIASFQYEKQKPTHYQSKSTPADLITAEIVKPILYTTKLTYAAISEDFEKVSMFLNMEDPAWKEAREWDKKGGLCIYASVLLYLLLLETNVVKKSDLKLMQGYYHHQFMDSHVFNNIIP